MSEIIYNKLIRDNVPQVIVASGETPIVRVLGDEEYRKRLLEKLVEEATELLESNGSLKERADVAEVLRALDELLGFEQSRIEEARERKARARGAFTMRLFLEKVISTDTV